MNRRRRCFVTVLAMLAAITWSGPEVRAQQEAPPPTVVIDAGGRGHEVMPMRRITPAQRQEAAQRMKATKAAQDQGTPNPAQGNQNAPALQGEANK